MPSQPVTVAYDPELPAETFYQVIVDEAHRSIYGVVAWSCRPRGRRSTPARHHTRGHRRRLLLDETSPSERRNPHQDQLINHEEWGLPVGQERGPESAVDIPPGTWTESGRTPILRKVSSSRG